jgi:uncharacterized protein (TIGR00251 family)
MIIRVRVKANAREDAISKKEGDYLVVKVKAPREKGLANASLLKTLSKEFLIPLSAIAIKSGHTCLKKTIEVQEPYAKLVFEKLSQFS